jgi:hypothetical protein
MPLGLPLLWSVIAFLLGGFCSYWSSRGRKNLEKDRVKSSEGGA